MHEVKKLTEGYTWEKTSGKYPFKLMTELEVSVACDEDMPTHRAIYRDAKGKIWLELEWDNGTLLFRVASGYAWNGCTAVPTPDGAVLASCLHDAIYQFCPDGVSRKMADEIFFQMMLDGGTPPAIAVIYFYGVRLFGATRFGK